MMKVKFILIISIFVLSLGSLKAQDAQAILTEMDQLMSAPIDRVATVEITIKNKKGNETVREASLKQKGANYRLYRYTKPENKAGIATLSHPDGKMWLFMPSFGKAVKITLLSKSQAFTGTDFSYEDMSGIPYSERFSASLGSSEKSGEYMLDLSPKTKETEYSRIQISINEEFGYPTEMAFYDKKGNNIKKAVYSYVKQGKYWYAEEVVMTDLRKDHSTKIIIKEVTFDTGLKDEDFTLEELTGKSKSD